jgi:transposase
MAWKGLTERQWKKIEPYLPERPEQPRGGRPWASDRGCFEGILWILWTGSQWSELPKKYPSPSTCWRRLREWEEDETLVNLWRSFLSQLNDKQKITWDECFADGTFVVAKKGVQKSEKPRGARVQSLWFWQMARVLRSEFTWRRLPRRRSPC